MNIQLLEQGYSGADQRILLGSIFGYGLLEEVFTAAAIDADYIYDTTGRMHSKERCFSLVRLEDYTDSLSNTIYAGDLCVAATNSGLIVFRAESVTFEYVISEVSKTHYLHEQCKSLVLVNSQDDEEEEDLNGDDSQG